MKKILGFILFILGIFILDNHFGFIELLTNIDNLRNLLEILGWIGYLFFILLSIVVAVFLLPGQFLAIVGGLVYGGFIGGCLTIVGASLGCTISFIIGKYLARDYIVQRFKNDATFQKIEQGVRENGISFLINIIEFNQLVIDRMTKGLSR